jgi:2-oxoglutarate dehydrogenase E2 component (dihydrolipoamide succinyltransferase)
MDEAVLEIATDKVDSEVPSEVAGTLVEILFNKMMLFKLVKPLLLSKRKVVCCKHQLQKLKVEAPVAVAEVAKTVEAAKESVAPAVLEKRFFWNQINSFHL